MKHTGITIFTIVATFAFLSSNVMASDATLFRFWSGQNKSHFYTSSLSEKEQVMLKYSNSEWKYEGEAYKVNDCTDTASSKVYRFWSPNNKHHFYTISETEKKWVDDTFTDAEWTLEGVHFVLIPQLLPIECLFIDFGHKEI